MSSADETAFAEIVAAFGDDARRFTLFLLRKWGRLRDWRDVVDVPLIAAARTHELEYRAEV